jgi:hydrogenase nickel incorporation protein HypA/HybF
MHELSIALGIVKIAQEELMKSKKTKIDIIELKIGTLAGIEFDALDFVWPMATKNTVLEDVERKIEIVQAKGKCLDCNIIFEMENLYDSCPGCQSHLKGIIQGKELSVKALEVS